MAAHHNLLVGMAALAAALLTGCGRPALKAASPAVLPPPPPIAATIPTGAPSTVPQKTNTQSQTEYRLRTWEAQLQQQQAALDRQQQEMDRAAEQARQSVATAPTPAEQFTSQPWMVEPRPLRDTAPLPPTTATIPSAVPGYRPNSAYDYTTQQPPTTPSVAEATAPSSATPRPERPHRVGIYGPGWPSAEPVYVRGYTRADGSYVRPHYRTYRTPR